MDITANDHPTKVVITDEGAPYANDHPFKVEIEGGGNFATKEDIEELNEKIAALATDLSYKGGVEDYDHLPQDPEQGDVYTTDDTGILWVWDGIKWVPLNDNQETILGTDTPTTSTEGELGQLYLDTTAGKVYILQTIDTSTTPAIYTWIAVGPTVVQTTGTSTTDVMSQNAVTSRLFQVNSAGTGYTASVKIGNAQTAANVDYSVAIGLAANASEGTNTVAIGGGPLGLHTRTSGTGATAIGSGANAGPGAFAGGLRSSATALRSVALGEVSSASAEGAVAIGFGASATTKGQFDISTGAQRVNGYNNSNYRLLSGVYPGQSEHDAATVGQIGSTISDQDFATLLNGTGA